VGASRAPIAIKGLVAAEAAAAEALLARRRAGVAAVEFTATGAVAPRELARGLLSVERAAPIPLGAIEPAGPSVAPAVQRSGALDRVERRRARSIAPVYDSAA